MRNLVFVAKRFVFVFVLSVMGIVNGFSWGQKGHDTVCAIAQRHLTKKAKAEIAKLLDGKSIVYWANWLDNASNTPEYAYSKTWHYKNIDEGQTFENAPLLDKGDIVRAIDAQVATLTNQSASRDEKQLALKMLIHLMGDMHQPLHMGHFSDLGGNKWQVRFFREGTNIHSLWDSKLVESAHKWSHTEWAEEIDRLSKAEQNAICQGTVSDWAKETYEICKQVYADTPVGSDNSYSYVAKWTPTVEQQFERAGLRLAYLLNQIF